MTSHKSALELAALATSAMPGLRVSALRPPTYTDELASVTGIEDVGGNRWIVTCPHEEVSGPALEATSGILDRLGQAYEHDYIPFDVPRLAGQAKIRGGGTVYVHRDPGGHAPTERDLETDPLLPASLGRALAALHNLPETVFSAIGLPSYTAMECRDRNLALLDEAARQVTIPPSLWSRWEAALEDVSLWRFPSAPIHGDIQERSLSVKRGSVVAIGGWTSAHVGDPALDIAWIQASASDAFLERFRETYGHERRAIDLHVFTRAQLLSEIALVRWLVHGLHAEDSSIVDDARAMLTDLAIDLDGEPLLPSHATSVGSASIDEASPASTDSVSSPDSSQGATSGSRQVKWRDRAAAAAKDEPETGASTQPVSRTTSAVARKLAEGEVDPAAPTERLRLGPDGTLIP
jgi:putative phosphotransferase